MSNNSFNADVNGAWMVRSCVRRSEVRVAQAKGRYQVKNWREQNESLVRRGDVTLWFAANAIDAWEHDAVASKVGRPFNRDQYPRSRRTRIEASEIEHDGAWWNWTGAQAFLPVMMARFVVVTDGQFFLGRSN